MKISADMVMLAPQFTNTLKDREIDLRENKIPMIENLGATLDQFDTVDFTNNEIRVLGGFPKFLRLKTVLLSNNRITRIEDRLHETVVNLEELQLTNNMIAELGDLKPLAMCKKLARLCLTGNPVSRLQHYRLYAIHLLPQLKVLDFQKIKEKERKDAEAMFTGPKGEALVKEIVKSTVQQTTIEEAMQKSETTKKSGLTPAQEKEIKMAIANAKTLQEVSALEAKLKSGEWGNGLNTDAMDVGK